MMPWRWTAPHRSQASSQNIGGHLADLLEIEAAAAPEDEAVPQLLIGRFAGLDRSTLRGRRQARGDADRITPHVVGGLAEADRAADHRAGIEADRVVEPPA